MRILLLDNYDSFTFNLAHYLEDLDQDISVIRNDKISVEEVEAFDAIVFSPGPGIPENAGNMPEIIKAYLDKKPMLGICLGMQAMAEAVGGELNNMDKVYHGCASDCEILIPDTIFTGLSNEFVVGRYHSWEVKNNLPKDFNIIAVEKVEKTVMAIKHKDFPVWGLQFHPESILTPNGKDILNNWIKAIQA